MGMTIDKAIAELELLKKNTFSYMSAHQAFITAIDTMRKYQKIDQIISDGYLQGKSSGEMLLGIKGVMNGNNK